MTPAALPARLLASVFAVAAGGCSPLHVVPRAAPAAASSTPVEFELAPGGRAALPGGGALRYVALATDSRCPSSVQCIHAGEAVTRLELATASRAHPFELATAAPRDVAVIDGHRVRLLDVSRGSPARVRIRVEPAD